jgi:hypothetical protein
VTPCCNRPWRCASSVERRWSTSCDWSTTRATVVPVLSNRVLERDEPTGIIDVIDKAALTSRLARSYLDELKEQARIT